MTENEMLKIAVHCLGVQAEQEVCEECPVYRESGIVCKEIARTAISALKEIQLYKGGKLCLVPEDVYSKQCCELDAYKEIGTVEECREAVEKQKSKSPTLEGDGYDEDGEMIYDTWICPSCGEDYEVDYDDYDFCPNCGQAINWEESEEE